MSKIVYGNLFGDARSEKISVRSDDGDNSDEILVGLPRSQRKTGEQPRYMSFDFSIDEFMPEGQEGDGRRLYRINHVGVADIDGDQAPDIYCEVTAYKKGFLGIGKVVSEQNFHLTLFNDDIKKAILTRDPDLFHLLEEEASSMNLEYRVDRLERQMRGWESSGLKRDLESEIRCLKRRIQVLEDELSPAALDGTSVRMSDRERLLYDLDQLRAELKGVMADLDDWDELEGRLSDVEEEVSDLKYRVDTLEDLIDR